MKSYLRPWQPFHLSPTKERLQAHGFHFPRKVTRSFLQDYNDLLLSSLCLRYTRKYMSIMQIDVLCRSNMSLSILKKMNADLCITHLDVQFVAKWWLIKLWSRKISLKSKPNLCNTTLVIANVWKVITQTSFLVASKAKSAVNCCVSKRIDNHVSNKYKWRTQREDHLL